MLSLARCYEEGRRVKKNVEEEKTVHYDVKNSIGTVKGNEMGKDLMKEMRGSSSKEKGVKETTQIVYLHTSVKITEEWRHLGESI